MSIANKIAKKLNVSIQRKMKINDGLYKITLTNNKTYALKRMIMPVQSLRWVDRTIRAIKKNGYSKLSWRNPNTFAGERLFGSYRQGGHPFVLMPWIYGRYPSVHSESDMRRCGIALAQYHKASNRYRTVKFGAINNVGKWPQMLRKRHILISQFIKRNGHLLGNNGAQMIAYSNQAKAMLKTFNYAQKCRTHRRLITVCHGDAGPTNFILNKSGVYFIDFETLQIDFRANDIYRAIYNAGQHNGWRFATIKAFLDGYGKVCKLEKADIELLSILLRSPRMVYLLMRHYGNVNKQGKAQIVKQLPHAIKMEMRITRLLKQLNAYI